MPARPFLTDTTPEANRTQLTLIRQESAASCLMKTFRMSDWVCQQCKAAIRRRHPDFSEDDVRIKFIEVNYGKELAEEVRAWRKSRLST